ncbi:MAG: hypothetical protein ACOC7U_09265, partial [Spirochaetota bacterium]
MVYPRFILTILLFLLLFLPFTVFSDTEGLPSEETLSPHTDPEDTSQQDTTIYRIIRTGGIQELKEACEQRGVSSEGDEHILKWRLLKYVKEKHLVPFEVACEKAGKNDIILKNSDFIEYYSNERAQEIMELTGNVYLEYEQKTIHADQMDINIDTGIITGAGRIVFKDGDKT